MSTPKTTLIEKIISLDPEWTASSLKKLTVKELTHLLKKCRCASGTPKSSPRPKTSPRPIKASPRPLKTSPRPKISKVKRPTKATLTKLIIGLGDTRSEASLMRLTAAKLEAILASLETTGIPLGAGKEEEEDEDDRWRKANPGKKNSGGMDAGYRLGRVVADLEARYASAAMRVKTSPKVSAKKTSPKASPKATPKKTTPKKTPKKVSPTKTPKKTSPKATPKKTTPKKTSPKKSSPKAPTVFTLIPRRKGVPVARLSEKI
jgi:hypothetical protein